MRTLTMLFFAAMIFLLGGCSSNPERDIVRYGGSAAMGGLIGALAGAGKDRHKRLEWAGYGAAAGMLYELYRQHNTAAPCSTCNGGMVGGSEDDCSARYAGSPGLIAACKRGVARRKREEAARERARQRARERAAESYGYGHF